LVCENNRLTALDISKNSKIDTYKGAGQTPTVVLQYNATTDKFERTIALNNPTTLADGLTYADGKLIADDSTTVKTSPFAVETGISGKSLSGTLTLKYTDQQLLYNSHDVALINKMIANNGAGASLGWSTADPADGSYIPEDWKNISWSDVANNKRVTDLELQTQNLTGALDVSGMTELKYLRVEGNYLTEIDLANTPALQSLSCANMNSLLTKIDVSECPALVQLFANNNPLTALDVSHNPLLEQLYVGKANLKVLDVSKNPKLTALTCNDNQLIKLDLTNNTALTTFSGSDQESALEMAYNKKSEKYESFIFLNQPSGLTSGLSSDNGKLISESKSVAITPFVVETGMDGKQLSGTLTLSYFTPPPRLYWSKDAVNGNWYDPANWSTEGEEDVNSENRYPVNVSTSVYLSGDAQVFPSLDPVTSPRNDMDEPACDSIIFGYGAELGQPHYLHYDKAFVYYSTQYYNDDYSSAFAGGVSAPDDDVDFASPGLTRGEWFALAAPLKKTVTGDFSFGGFPYTWQQQFKSTRVTYDDEKARVLTGGWHPTDPNLALEIGADMNYAICLFIPKYAEGVLGVDDQKCLQNLKGAIKLPYFEDAFAEPEHPAHSYEDGVSKIYYFLGEAGFPLIDDMYDKIERGDEAYRFVFEDDNNQPQDPFIIKIPIDDNDEDNEIDEVMIGNPFMSSLDISKLYEANSDKIEKFYRIYHDETFETNPIGSGNVVPVLQAFFVKPIGTLGTEVELTFTKEMSVTRSGDMGLRSSKSASTDELPKIKLTVANDGGSNFTTFVFYREDKKNVDWMLYNAEIGLLDNKTPDYADMGVWDQPAMPLIYSLDLNMNARAIQYIAANGLSSEIPIGIRVPGNASGAYKLLFETGSTLNPKAIYVLDKLTGKKFSPVDLDDYEFTVESGYDPAFLDDRFSLLIGKQIFIDDATGDDGDGDDGDSQGIDEATTDEVYVYADGRHLQVTSSGDAISEITVTALQGIRIASLSGIGEPSCSMQLPTVAQGIYIVRVKLENGVTKIKKLKIEM
jgi:hypothetical protein